MRPSVAIIAAGLSLVPTATTAAARPVVSWGKAGVSFDQYRWDSVECGKQGATRDMSGRQEYGEVIHGLKLQDTVLDTESIIDGTGHVGEGARDYSLDQRRTMQQQVPALQRFLVSGVERCLIGRGYRPFTLTRQQTEALGKLAHGSDARFHYLHMLAADPAILTAQGIERATDAAGARQR